MGVIHLPSLGRGKKFSVGRSLTHTLNLLGNLKSWAKRSQNWVCGNDQRDLWKQLRLPECKRETRLDPATQYSPAVLEVRRGNPLNLYLATSYRIIFSWAGFTFSKLIRRLWESLRFLSPWPLPLQTLPWKNICCWGSLWPFSDKENLGGPFTYTHRWTRESEEPLWWVHTYQKSVDGFFSLEGFLRHLRNVQIFCLTTRKTAKLRAGERTLSC